MIIPEDGVTTIPFNTYDAMPSTTESASILQYISNELFF